ncbi:MAG: hypothetical protein ABWX60_00465 [Aeromicrobium sp.]
MNVFHKDSAWEKVTKPLPHVPGRSLVISGVTAGATVVALSVASAATSALRRRVERP